jgi:uncharacterized protein (TIGR03000 family)
MMCRRWFAWLGFAVMAVAVLVIAVDPASAQRFGRSGFYWNGSGIGYGNPYDGYGNPYYGGSGYGSGCGNYPTYNRGWAYNNWGNYPGYTGSWAYNTGQNYPGYSGAWWNAPGYSQSTGGYYGDGMQGDYYSSTMGMTSSTGTMGQGSMGTMSQGSMDGRVLINVRVPPNAEVWFDDQKTSQTGSLRSFVTPALNPDHDFVYHIRARWTENGRQVEKTRRIDVHSGDRLFVNFLGRGQEGMGTSSGQYGAPPSYDNEPANRGEDRSLEHRDRTLEDRNRNTQENPDRTLNTQPGNVTPNNPPTQTENRSTTPPNKTNQPPVKQP